jgi:type I restriction enzyme, R subunit
LIKPRRPLHPRLELEEDEKADFKIKAKQFVKIYAQIAAMLPFNEVPWEMLYWFLKFLIPKLHIATPTRKPWTSCSTA